jgi:uncharacterized OB-fold protein
LRCCGLLPARYLPRLRGAHLAWETSSGRGVVYATTAVYRREGDPYNVVLVDLEEGFRMMSRVQGVPAEEVEVGARVTLRLEPTDDGPIPVFVPGGEDS